MVAAAVVVVVIVCTLHMHWCTRTASIINVERKMTNKKFNRIIITTIIINFVAIDNVDDHLSYFFRGFHWNNTIRIHIPWFPIFQCIAASLCKLLYIFDCPTNNNNNQLITKLIKWVEFEGNRRRLENTTINEREKQSR